MNSLKKYTAYLLVTFALTSCSDNKLEVEPKNKNFPFRLILDADEGGDLADSEEYDLEVKFADVIGGLPQGIVTVDYEISDLTDDMIGSVLIDKISYETDEGDVDLDFTASADGLTGTITLNNPGTDELPEEFEIVFTLPGEEDLFFATGGFKFSLSNLQAAEANVLLGTPFEFEYEVLDHELAGSWEVAFDNEESFNTFKEVFGSLSPELSELEFTDVKDGGVVAVEFEFEYEEVNIAIEYINTENEEIEFEIEGEYDFEDGELEFEGSHLIIGDDGEIEDELDFSIKAEYSAVADILDITFFEVIDEDNYEEGEELFASPTGSILTLEKD
jgi:hypothetical protein